MEQVNRTADVNLKANGQPRQRVSIACTECRTRRIRCDGEQPTCGSCRNRSVQCHFNFRENRRKPPTKRYVESLCTRIRALEAQLEALGHPEASSMPQLGEECDDDGQEESEDSGSDHAEHDALQARNPMDELADRTGALNVGEDGSMRYYGSASNFSFLHGRMWTESSAMIFQNRQHALTTVRQLGLSVEPSAELRSHLFDLFWRWQNTWQYIVHKPLFLRDTHLGVTGKYSNPLLVSAVLALASRYSDRPEVRGDVNDPATAGCEFAQQAKMLLHYEFDSPTLSTVQATCLITLFEFAVNREASAWTYMGVATRMAYNLGLHLNCSRWVQMGHIDNEEADVRMATWWGCYLLDKLVNIGLGRPSSIQDHDVSTPKLSLQQDVENESWTFCTDLGSPSPSKDPLARIISTSHYACELFTIMSATFDILYAPNSKLTRHQRETLVSTADVNLTKFHTNLPSFLRLPNSARSAALPHVCQLHLQYHVAVILLHRPFVSMKPRRRSTPSHDRPQNNHLQLCRSSANEVANIMRVYKLHYSLRRIAISAVHCTFTASVVHLYDATCTDPVIHQGGRRRLQMCIEFLRDMSTAWSWSLRAICAIQMLAGEWLQQSEDVVQMEPVPDVPVLATIEPADQTMGTVLTTAVAEESFGWLFEVDTGQTMDAPGPNTFIDWDQDPFWRSALGFEPSPNSDPSVM